MDDLDLVVGLINTIDARILLEGRPGDVEAYRAILRANGQSGLACQLNDSDLECLRWLSAELRAVFETADARVAARRLNSLLCRHNLVPQLQVNAEGAVGFCWGAGYFGYTVLVARLIGSLIEHVTANGPSRLGVCAATPCERVFVDRSRPGVRKFCTEACNNRVAAMAYYRRRRALRGR